MLQIERAISSDGHALFHYSSLSLPEFFIQANKIIKLGEKTGSCGSAAYKKQRVVVENIDTHENWQKYLKVTKKATMSI